MVIALPLLIGTLPLVTGKVAFVFDEVLFITMNETLVIPTLFTIIDNIRELG